MMLEFGCVRLIWWNQCKFWFEWYKVSSILIESLALHWWFPSCFYAIEICMAGCIRWWFRRDFQIVEQWSTCKCSRLRWKNSAGKDYKKCFQYASDDSYPNFYENYNVVQDIFWLSIKVTIRFSWFAWICDVFHFDSIWRRLKATSAQSNCYWSVTLMFKTGKLRIMFYSAWFYSLFLASGIDLGDLHWAMLSDRDRLQHRLYIHS